MRLGFNFQEMRYLITFSYLGTNYHGWQIQPNGNTVQEELNKAISTLCREEILTTGAGRTDTGVHARMMTAHFDANNPVGDGAQFVYRINKLLPKDIAVSAIKEVDSEFSARFSATERTYRYYITKDKDPFTLDTVAYINFDLDIELMNKAASILFEYEDFTSFSKVNTDTKTNNCTITHAEWYMEGNILVFRISANRFLRNMVRAIVGTLIDVGRKKITIAEFRKIIESKDRSKASTSAPACGLFLEDIKY